MVFRDKETQEVIDEVAKEDEDLSKTVERAYEKVEKEYEAPEIQEPEDKEDKDGLLEEDEKGEEKEVEREEEPVVEDPIDDPSTSDDTTSEDDDLDAEFEPGEIAPIEFWPDEVKAEFKKMPPAAQEFYIQSYKGMTTGYNKRIEAIKDVTEALKPMEQELVENGLTFGDGIRRMVGMHTKLLKNPKDAIFEVMALYGIEPKALLETGDAPTTPAADPRVDEIQKELAARRDAEAETAAAAYQADIDEFKKDHPLYDEVEPELVNLAKRYSMAGQTVPKVGKLYEEFCWSSPKYRQKMLEEQKVSATKERANERKKKVAKAKNASRSGRKRTVQASPENSAGKTLRDVLAEQFDAAEARAPE